MLKKGVMLFCVCLIIVGMWAGGVFAETKKAALLTSGPVNDGGWNQYAYEGLLLIAEKYGWEVANTENVGQADQLQIIRSYANQGYDLIIGHGFEYEDALTRAAREYPDVYFLQIGGNAENGSNLGSAVFALGHSGYLPGVLCAKLTKTNKIGFIGAMAIPTVDAEFAAARAAIKKYNPDAQIITAYTGSWVDVGKAKEAALAQIAAGVDIIIPIGDACNVGVVEAAKEHNVWVIGWSRDQSPLAPDLVVASLEQRVDWAIAHYAEEIVNGTFKGQNELLGLDNGYVRFEHFLPVVSDDIVKELENVKEQVIKGEVDVISEDK